MNDHLELRTLFRAIRHRWWILPMITLAMGVLAYGVSLQQTPVYQATTSLLVGRSIQNAADIDRYDLETGWQLAQTYADIAKRQPILQRTIDELGLDMTWSELRSRVRSGVSDKTQLMEIRVEASSPQDARRIADEIAQQLILLSPSGDQTTEQFGVQEFAIERIETLKKEIRDGQQQIEVLEAEMLKTDSSEESGQYLEQINLLNNLIAAWENTYLKLITLSSANSQTNDLVILEPAQGSDVPVRPRPLVNVLVLMLVGFVIGLGLVFLLALMDHSLRTPDDIDRELGLSTVGAIQSIRSNGTHGALGINHDPFSPAFESYRLLRSKIQFMTVQDHGRTVMITSPGRGEGKSVTAANFGIVMAQAGFRTVLVDANLRTPVLHELFQVGNDQGLTHILRSQDCEIRSHLRSTLVPNLSLLPSGVMPSNPSDLLGSSQMSFVLNELANAYDVVICDTPEAVTVADASVLSNKVDAVLLVIDAGHTDRSSAVQALINLRDANATVLGCILNRSGSKQSAKIQSHNLATDIGMTNSERNEALTLTNSTS